MRPYRRQTARRSARPAVGRSGRALRLHPMHLVLLVLLGAACANADADRATIIFHGGTILTLDEDRTDPEAVAVRGGVIQAVGSREEVFALEGPGTRVVDLDGRTLMPSLTDHHLHLLGIGLAALQASDRPELYVDVSGADTAEIAARIGRRAARLREGEWVLGRGWSQGSWGGDVLPDHRVLSRALPDHPVFLSRSDAHAGWVNAAALERAGITASTADPAGGRIVRFEDGRPTGLLLERANELVLRRVPDPSAGTVRRAFRAAAEALAARGITDVFDAGFLAPGGVVNLAADFGRYLRLLRQVDADRPLPLGVNLMVPAPSALADSVVASPDRYASLSPRLAVTHLKLFADGALGSRGASLTHPYADDPSTAGVARMTAVEIEAWARRALDAGFDVATHAIGDATVQRTLDAYAEILSTRPDTDPHRLRIEHFSYVRPSDFERAADLGVVVVVQPGFVGEAGSGPSLGELRVGAGNDARVYAWRTMLTTGVTLAATR